MEWMNDILMPFFHLSALVILNTKQWLYCTKDVSALSSAQADPV